MWDNGSVCENRGVNIYVVYGVVMRPRLRLRLNPGRPDQ